MIASSKMLGYLFAVNALLLLFAGQSYADTVLFEANFIVTAASNTCVPLGCSSSGPLGARSIGDTFQKTFTLDSSQLLHAGSYDVSASLQPLFSPPTVFPIPSPTLTASAVVSAATVTGLSINFQAESAFSSFIAGESFVASGGAWSDRRFLNGSEAGNELDSSGTFTIKAVASSLMWIDHLDFLSGDPAYLTTSFNSTNSGIGSGLSGLVISSSTIGDTFPSPVGGNKVIEKGLEVPPGYVIKAVRVCYQWSSGATSSIDDIRLSQLQNPPSVANVIIDDTTVLNSTAPICANGAETTVDPRNGPVRLDLRFNFVSTTDTMVLRGVGLWLVPAPLAGLF